MTRTVAAVDCGTNSIRLLVLRDEDGRVQELARETRLARLGQGVDATGEFHPDALQRAFVIFDEYRAIIDANQVDATRVVATSAARDVSNRGVFEAGVRERLGVDVDVISGDEEARLSSTGVLSGVDTTTPALVLDIGGGSTELVVIGESREILHAISLDIGAVRVKERCLHSDPATGEQIEAARAFVAEQLDGAGVEWESLASAIGVAGTVTTLAARKLALVEYQREAIHETELTRDDIVAATEHWLARSADEIATEPCMHPLRAQVIAAGALILEGISERIPGGSVLVSETDILDGIALSVLER